MRFLSLVGLYQKSPSTAASLGSGVYWTTAPTDLPPLGSLAVEDGNVYMLGRLSATCTVGAILYRGTGTMGYGGGASAAQTGMIWLNQTGTGNIPQGVSMVAPTTSGAWTWIQVYGKNTTIQVTNTFGANGSISAALYAGGQSALLNLSAYITGIISATAGFSAPYFYVGQSLTDATGSTTVGFINLL